MLTYKKNIFTKIFVADIPVVFLHAFPVNQEMWEPQMQFLKEMKISYAAVDYPGFGRSILTEKEMRISDYGEYVYDILRDAGVQKALFVGLSMGGYVALALYRAHPEIFAGLLLANTRAAADDEAGRKKRMEMVDSLKKSMDFSSVISTHLEKFFTPATRQENPALIERAGQLMHNSTVAGVIQAQLAMAGRPDSLPLLPRMDFPVTVVAGEADELIPLENAEEMARMIPGASLEIIPGAAHLSNMEQSERFNEILWRLIQKVRTLR